VAIANPTLHARAAADGLARLVRDVRSGRARWTHPQHVRQSTEELARVADSIAAAVGEMTAVLAQLEQPGPHAQQTNSALHQAVQGATTAAAQLRAARRLMH
jgi:methyl-accepting chemotaxis protein